VKVFNLHGDEWDMIGDREGFRVRDAHVGRRLGAELIGGSLYELDPGERNWPYHLHHANEEWLVVLRGRPTLRTPDGNQVLDEGDVACFRRGHAGAHQVSNESDRPVRFLMLSTMIAPELVEYPDSGKLGARDAKGNPLLMIRPGEQLDYWDGEP
jgi:uncharacterized cupin superfamily protein